jgi:hypothetical protein
MIKWNRILNCILLALALFGHINVIFGQESVNMNTETGPIDSLQKFSFDYIYYVPKVDKKPIATKYELGTLYKLGFFSGGLNNIYSKYQFFKPFYIGFHYEWFYYDIGASLFGVVNKMNKGEVGHTPIDGSFYGKATDFYLSLGGEFFNNDRIAATGTANLYAIIWNNHFRPTKIFHKPSAINKESNEFGNSLSGFGPGIFIDYKFWDFKKSSDNGLAFRLRYNAFIWTWGDDYGKDGMMHELSVGLVVILHEKN